MKKHTSIPKKALHSYIAVSIATVLAATFGMMIDAVVVGRFLGPVPLAALGIVSPIFLISAAIGNCISSGASNRCSILKGRGEVEQINNTFTISLLSSGVLSMVLVVIGYVFAKPIAVFLGADSTTLPFVLEYLKGLLWGIIPTILSTVLMSLVRIDGSKSLPLIAILAMTIVNVILDLLMVVVLNIGMFGIGIATSIAYTIAVLVTLVHFTKPISTYRFVKTKSGMRELLKIVNTGFPTSLNRIAASLRTLILNNYLFVLGGVAAVTAMSIRSNTYIITGAITMGIAQALLPIAGFFFGDINRRSLRIVFKETLFLGLGINITCAIIVCIFSPAIVTLFGVTQPYAAVKICIEAVISLAVSMPLMLMNLVLLNFYQSTKRIKMANTICVGQGILLITLFSFFLAPIYGTLGVWISFVLCEAAMLIIVFLFIAFKNKRLPLCMDDWMLLPTDFDDDLNYLLEVTLPSGSCEIAQLCTAIAEDVNMDEKLAANISRFVEVTADSIHQNIIVKRKKGNTEISVCVKAIEDKIKVSLMWYGEPFDPIEPYSENMDAQFTNYSYRNALNINIAQQILENNKYDENPLSLLAK